MVTNERIKSELDDLKDTLVRITDRINELEAYLCASLADNSVNTDDPRCVRSTSEGFVAHSGLVKVGNSRFSWERSIKDPEYLFQCPEETTSELFGAFSNPMRIKLLKALIDGPKNSCELMDTVNPGTTGQMYHHLKELQLVGYVRQNGKAYEITPDAVAILLTVLAITTEHELAETDSNHCKCTKCDTESNYKD